MPTSTLPALGAPVQSRDDVAHLSDPERRLLASWLSEVTLPIALTPRAQRRRRHILGAATMSAAVLVPWLVVLAVTLPDRHRSHEWRLAWVGFDAALTLAFAATAWFGWRSRQVVITAFVVTATLLLCDAWFDVLLSWGGSEQTEAVLTAAFVELPLAAFLLTVYHRLLRSLSARIWRDRGFEGDLPPLRRLPLLVRALPAQELPTQ